MNAEEEEPGEIVDFMENSTIMSGTEKGYYDDVEINFDWEDELNEYNRDGDWAPTSRAHRAALKLLAQALKSTSRTVGRDMKRLDMLLQRNIPSLSEDAKARAALQHLVETHGSLAETVHEALASGGAADGDLEELREDMNAFSGDLKKYSEVAEVSKKSILEIISRIRERFNSRHAEIKEWVSRLEYDVARAQRPASPHPPQVEPTTSQVLAASSGIDEE